MKRRKRRMRKKTMTTRKKIPLPPTPEVARGDFTAKLHFVSRLRRASVFKVDDAVVKCGIFVYSSTTTAASLRAPLSPP